MEPENCGTELDKFRKEIEKVCLEHGFAGFQFIDVYGAGYKSIDKISAILK